MINGGYIPTGFESEVIIHVKTSEGKHALMTVKNLTEFAIDQLFVEDNLAKTSLRLKMGEVKTKVKTERRIKANFEIVTPTSTVGVRGTEFTVGYDKDKKETSLKVSEGSVDFTDENGEGKDVILTGEQVKMGEDGKIEYSGEGYSEMEVDSLFYLVVLCSVIIIFIGSGISLIVFRKKKKVFGVIVFISGILISAFICLLGFILFVSETNYQKKGQEGVTDSSDSVLDNNNDIKSTDKNDQIDRDKLNNEDAFDDEEKDLNTVISPPNGAF